MNRIILGSKTSGETVTEMFDFTSRLTSAETISTASTTATVYSGTDATPSAIVSGSASISGKVVSQTFTGGTTGNIYQVVCSITTSLGQTLKMIALLAIAQETS